MTRSSFSWLSSAFAITALAGAACASDTVTTFKLQCSDDGIHWTSQLNLASSSQSRRILFRTTVSWFSDNLPDPLGFASVTFQPVFGGFRVADTIAPFVNAGFNGNGGGVVLDSSPLDGPFGRPAPFAATGPALGGTQWYAVHEHNGTDGAPPGRFLRIARNDITRWIGIGTATIGTNAVNNFNGAGGIAIVQNSVVAQRPTDPGFQRGLQDVVIFQIGLDIAPTAPGEVLDLSVDIPPLAFGRDPYQPPLLGKWYRGEGNALVSTRIEVVPAAIHVPGPSIAAIIACAALPKMRRSRRGDRVVSSRA